MSKYGSVINGIAEDIRDMIAEGDDPDSVIQYILQSIEEDIRDELELIDEDA